MIKVPIIRKYRDKLQIVYLEVLHVCYLKDYSDIYRTLEIMEIAGLDLTPDYLEMRILISTIYDYLISVGLADWEIRNCSYIWSENL